MCRTQRFSHESDYATGRHYRGSEKQRSNRMGQPGKNSVRSRVDESIVLNGFGCAWRLHSSYTAKSLIRSKRMSDLKGIEYKRFEDIKHIREDGSEYWSARELGPALDYAKWDNFAKVIKRAMIACENSGHSIPDDFPEVRKIVEAGVTTKPKKDYELSRYACYLIVQNGDPRKEVIALGQTYFAIQTYRQEVADHFNELDEDNRRLVVRGDIKQWNQMLAETAHNAGVITNEEFAIFQNAGYMGLYGGLDVDDIHTKKQLEVGQKILDYMGSTELIANLFRISQTEEKLRKDKIVGAETATSVHYNVGKEVRTAIEKIGGTMPEDLPTPEKSIQQIEKEQMQRLKNKAKKGKLMLDE